MNLALVYEQLCRAIAETDAARHSNAVGYGQTAESRRIVEAFIAQAQDALSHAAAHLHSVEDGAASHARFVQPVSRYTDAEYAAFLDSEVAMDPPHPLDPYIPAGSEGEF